MKIHLSKGCYSERITIDDKDIEGYSDEELLAVINIFLRDKATTPNLIEIIKFILDIFGDTVYGKYLCEQCGDSGYEIDLEI